MPNIPSGRKPAVALRLVLLCLCLAAAAIAPDAAQAAWSSAALPQHTAPDAVACLSGKWCEGVGAWARKPTAVHWDGTRWSAQSAPAVPHGAVSTSLFGIRCRSATSCVAVGTWNKKNLSPERPLIETWNGSSWHTQSVPSAPAPTGFNQTNDVLYGVFCPGAKTCFAVGDWIPFGAAHTAGWPLIERWNGAAWSVQKAAGRATGPLRSVSCSSSQACTAVGDVHLVERWNGTSWSRQRISPPAGTRSISLFGASCTAIRTCTAVGTAGQSLVARWNGRRWTASQLLGDRATLRSVACQTRHFCAAVGSWTGPTGRTGPLADVWDGTAWSQTTIHRSAAPLDSVACPALGWCMAVGGGIAERWHA